MRIAFGTLNIISVFSNRSSSIRNNLLLTFLDVLFLKLSNSGTNKSSSNYTPDRATNEVSPSMFHILWTRASALIKFFLNILTNTSPLGRYRIRAWRARLTEAWPSEYCSEPEGHGYPRNYRRPAPSRLPSIHKTLCPDPREPSSNPRSRG